MVCIELAIVISIVYLMLDSGIENDGETNNGHSLVYFFGLFLQTYNTTIVVILSLFSILSYQWYILLVDLLFFEVVSIFHNMYTLLCNHSVWKWNKIYSMGARIWRVFHNSNRSYVIINRRYLHDRKKHVLFWCRDIYVCSHIIWYWVFHENERTIICCIIHESWQIIYYFPTVMS